MLQEIVCEGLNTKKKVSKLTLQPPFFVLLLNFEGSEINECVNFLLLFFFWGGAGVCYLFQADFEHVIAF